MPHRCCVPTCRSNYNNEGQNISMFSFPREENLRAKWIWNIKRDDFTPTKHSRVCEMHFKESDVLRETSAFDEKKGKLIVARLERPRLKDGAIPCLFPKGPAYLNKDAVIRESPEKKRLRRELDNINDAIEESKKTKCEYDSKNTFCNLLDLKNCLDVVKLPQQWTILGKENQVLFVKIINDKAPTVKFSLVMNNDLISQAYSEHTEIKVLDKYKFPMKIDNVLVLEEVLMKINDSTENLLIDDKLQNNIHCLKVILQDLIKIVPHKITHIQFLIEQVDKLSVCKNRLRYSADFIVLSSLLYSISPHSYKFLRGSDIIFLPHPETIHRVCSTHGINPINEDLNNNFLGYIKQKFNFLKEMDLTVTLMLDEIHLKSMFDYKGGKICGMAYNSPESATTAHVFMIRSLLSPFQEVVHILPVSKLTAEELFFYIKEIIIGLEKIGFKVICVLSDNNAINKKAMSFFSEEKRIQFKYTHPSDAARYLYFLIDSVHLVKCIRNNWLNQKNSGQRMFFPDFDSFKTMETASFQNLKKLYEIESNELVKFGYGLTMKALCPTNLERQNVKLALQVFDRRVAEALLLLGPTHHLLDHKGTADFIEIICKWWTIVNVKSPFKGLHKNDVYCQPLTSNADDVKFSFLKKFISWLDSWKERKCDTGTLSRETHDALKLTTAGLVDFTDYCMSNLKFKYILTGKLQTDVLENRFGKYRQLAGSQHHISIRQVYENENKLRLQSYLPEITSSIKGEIPLHFSVSESDFCDEDDQIQKLKQMPSKLSGIAISDSEMNGINEMPLLTFIAGYCCFKIGKKLNCEICKNSLTLEKELTLDNNSYDWIRNFDRGLTYPHPNVLCVVVCNYLIVKKLVSKDFEEDFLKCTDHRSSVHYITTNIIIQKELFLDFNNCVNHSKDDILKYLIRCSTNTFLNNYCKKTNDKIFTKSKEKAKNKTATRKLKTLTK